MISYINPCSRHVHDDTLDLDSDFINVALWQPTSVRVSMKNETLPLGAYVSDSQARAAVNREIACWGWDPTDKTHAFRKHRVQIMVQKSVKLFTSWEVLALDET